jgi:hypothetical protein
MGMVCGRGDVGIGLGGDRIECGVRVRSSLSLLTWGDWESLSNRVGVGVGAGKFGRALEICMGEREMGKLLRAVSPHT